MIELVAPFGFLGMMGGLGWGISRWKISRNIKKLENIKAQQDISYRIDRAIQNKDLLKINENPISINHKPTTLQKIDRKLDQSADSFVDMIKIAPLVMGELLLDGAKEFLVEDHKGKFDPSIEVVYDKPLPIKSNPYDMKNIGNVEIINTILEREELDNQNKTKEPLEKNVWQDKRTINPMFKPKLDNQSQSINSIGLNKIEVGDFITIEDLSLDKSNTKDLLETLQTFKDKNYQLIDSSHGAFTFMKK